MNEFEISLVQDDPLFRLQRRVGLIPDHGLGLIRRALFFALLAWLPIMVWAIVKGRALPGALEEPLFQHFGIHVRYLVAVPLLILGEGMAHRVTTHLIPYFLTSGLVREEQRGAFRELAAGFVRLRNSTRPWVIILVILGVWLGWGPSPATEHELIWAVEGQAASLQLGFGGWWLAYVARPLFIALLAAWLWRLVMAFLLLKRIAGLDLALVPTHPDQAGGLGFLEKLTSAFSLFAFAISAVVASRMAHEVVYHGAHVLSFKALILVFIFLVATLCLAPLLVFVPRLVAAKRQALLQYGVLIGEHGRQVHRRWIQGEAVAESRLLDAPELGPVADTLSLYEAVTKMRAAPIGKAAILAVALPAALPMLALFAMEVPIKELLLKIAGILL